MLSDVPTRVVAGKSFAKIFTSKWTFFISYGRHSAKTKLFAYFGFKRSKVIRISRPFRGKVVFYRGIRVLFLNRHAILAFRLVARVWKTMSKYLYRPFPVFEIIFYIARLCFVVLSCQFQWRGKGEKMFVSSRKCCLERKYLLQQYWLKGNCLCHPGNIAHTWVR